MSTLSIMKKEDGYWLSIDGQKKALLNLNGFLANGIVAAAIDEAALTPPAPADVERMIMDLMIAVSERDTAYHPLADPPTKTAEELQADVDNAKSKLLSLLSRPTEANLKNPDVFCSFCGGEYEFRNLHQSDDGKVSICRSCIATLFTKLEAE